MATKASEKSRIPRAKRSSIVPVDPLPAIKVQPSVTVESTKPNVGRKPKKSKSTKSEQKENVRVEKKSEELHGGEARRHLSVLDTNRAKRGSR